MSNQYRELAKGDKQLIDFAMSIDGLNPEQQAYIAYMGRQLMAYDLGFANNVIWYQLLAFLVLSANYISVGITGTGYLECNSAKSLSFTVNLIAALLSGTAQLFLFDKAAQHAQTAGARLRWEFWQFVGSSQEYRGLGIEERYAEFTARTDALIGDDLAAQNNLISKAVSGKDKASKAIDEIHRAEEGRIK